MHFKISARKRESEQQVYIKIPMIIIPVIKIPVIKIPVIKIPIIIRAMIIIIPMIKIAAKWGDGDHNSS